jgi:hypothetical protein
VAAISGAGASIKFASYANAVLTDEVLTDSGDHKIFNISSSSFATKRIWDRLATFTVQTTIDGGSNWIAAVAGYTIRYLTGQVTLFAPLVPGTVGCRIHAGAYLPLSTAANAKMWEVSAQAGKLESTVFTGSAPVWKTYVPGLLESSIKLSQWWADHTWITILTTSGTASGTLVAELYTGRSTYERYSGFARIAQDDIKVPVNGLIEEPIDLIADSNLIYFAGQYS